MNRRQLPQLLVLLVVPALLGGCTATRLQGKILDDDHRPLSRVDIETIPPTDYKTSGLDGSFLIDRVVDGAAIAPLQEGRYTLKLKKAGFKTQEIPVTIQGDTQLGDIVLPRKPLEVDPDSGWDGAGTRGLVPSVAPDYAPIKGGV
ncbi:MAG: hypothetical protein RBU45_19120 [Myxococcota bacterium]|jgi:hypothetical protein|nr:hypothetical protein [Myxococcota bacterium]